MDDICGREAVDICQRFFYHCAYKNSDLVFIYEGYQIAPRAHHYGSSCHDFSKIIIIFWGVRM